jgi:hypothetical protein
MNAFGGFYSKKSVSGGLAVDDDFSLGLKVSNSPTGTESGHGTSWKLKNKQQCCDH